MTERDWAQRQWRSIDSLTLINMGVEANIFHRLPPAECWWDERCYCFWVLKGSRSDFWLSLQNI